MSREFKISSIRQADDAINTVNERLRAARREIDRRISDVQRQADQVAQLRARDEAQRAKREMTEQLKRSISGVNSRIDQVDREQRRRLDKVAGQIYDTITTISRDLHNEIGQTRAELKNDMRSLEQRTNERIKEVNRHLSELETRVARRFDQQQAQIDTHSRQIGDLTNTVNSILAHINDERQKRREAIDLARGVLKAAYSRIDIDRFNPQKAPELQRRMAALEANPDDEATVARASEAILQIQMAEEEAMRQKIIYDALMAEAVALAAKVLQEVNSNRNVQIAHPDSPQDVATLETDYWNRGEYQKLADRIQALEAELGRQPSLERIKEIMAEIAAAEVNIGEMVTKASSKAILSENRVTITEDIVTALIAQGWQIEQMPDGRDAVDYLGGEDRDNDWREGVFAVLTSMNGERISIVVRANDDENDNEIVFHRNDDRNITDLEYMRSLERIKAQIAKSGFELGPTVVPQGGGNTKIPIMTNPAQMGRRGAAKTIKNSARRK